MKNNIKTILSIVIIIILGIFIYFLVNNNKDTVVKEKPPAIIEDSLIGCYIVHLGKDIYTLNIQSENNGVVTGILAYNNYQKDSSSGSFTGIFKDDILLGVYSFDSEGVRSNSQLIFKKIGTNFIQGFGSVTISGDKQSFDPISAVTYDTKSTFIKSNNCLEKFTDINNVISFEYNSFFKQIEGDNIPSLEWRVDAKEKGILLTSVIIPRTFMPNTNFSNAKFTVGKSSTENAVKSCITDVTNGSINGGTITINRYPFTEFTISDAGVGNLYETTSYRGIVNKDCYAIEYTIHSVNIDNYSPDQNIKEFDKFLIQNNLDKIIKSINFNIVNK